MVDTKILRRIEKCLALAESSNANEAATAMRQARALMDRHNVDHDTLSAAKVNAVSPNTEFRAEKMPKHLMWLCSVVAAAFSTRVFVQKEYRTVTLASGLKRNKLVQVPVFYGVGADAEIAAYTFDFTARSMEVHRKEYLKTLGRMDAAEKTKLANSFCVGWVLEIRDTVNTFAGDIPEEKAKAMDVWVKQTHGEMRVTRSRRMTMTREQAIAMDAGREKGADVRLYSATGHEREERYLSNMA